MTVRILTISAPGDDRGPGVMYRNHRLACSETGDFEIKDLNQQIWSSNEELRSFDFAWGYVRFQPVVLQRLCDLNIPVIGGPNIVLENAHEGISDEYESWYLTKSNVKINLNVAKYYSDYVAKFVKNGMRCEVLEGCYDVSRFNNPRLEKDIDVLLYNKVRINDSKLISKERLQKLKFKLEKLGLKTYTLEYGNYDRNEYINLCLRSKVVAWLSIEDYASLAQIEAHLAGACVVGTPYNLTIPVLNESLCNRSQTINNWIAWNDTEIVVNDYVDAINNVLSFQNLDIIVKNKANERHSFETYRKNLMTLVSNISK